MAEIPDLCVFMHRLGPVHEEQMASLARHTKTPFNLIYHYGPGTAHANINACLKRCTGSRFVVIMDDDVVFLHDGWLDRLLQILDDYPSVGMVTPQELKNPKDRSEFDTLQQGMFSDSTPRIWTTTWNPGYIMAIDTHKVSVRADEDIPGPSGMSDLDISFQVRTEGFDTAMTTDVVVYHPDKPVDDGWRNQHQIVPASELLSLHDKQVAYMRNKYGGFFDNNLKFRALDILLKRHS